MNDQEIIASLCLSALDCISSVHFQHLMNHFHSSQEALEAGPTNWGSIFLGEKEQKELKITNFRETEKMASQELEEAKAAGIKILVWGHEGYPPLLAEIYDAPPIIYVRGEDFWGSASIALVGSRRCSYYGQKVARRLTADLVTAGLVTVSGLARGIDSVVHEETLNCGGRTMAVLGSGLLNIYPPENKGLADKICQSGVLLSEFPLHTDPLSWNFPKRNRIISGLSLGCVVIEGSQKSGALITAKLAAEQGREVFAVPGSIFSDLSRGPHYLIKNGAKPVQNSEEIIEEIKGFLPQQILKKPDPDQNKDLHLNPIYENILSFIGVDPIHKDDLVKITQQDVHTLAEVLLDLELKGMVKSLPGGFVVLA